MCYHVKFDSSATKGVRINRREPPKLGSTFDLGPTSSEIDFSDSAQMEMSLTRERLPIQNKHRMVVRFWKRYTVV